MATMLIESLKRLYARGEISLERLEGMVGKSITDKDFEYIAKE